MPTNLLTNQECFQVISGSDDSNSPKPAGFSAQVTAYPDAYLALVGNNTLHFIPRAPGDYTVTISGHSQDGTALPDVVLSFHVSTPPVPQATHFVVSDPVIQPQNIGTPGDPGTDTVTGSV